MLVRKTLEELADVLEPMREQADFRSAKITVNEIGKYHVSSSHGGWYKVECGRTRKGFLKIDCFCRAGQFPGKACYHALIAFEKHVELMTELKKWQKCNLK